MDGTSVQEFPARGSWEAEDFRHRMSENTFVCLPLAAGSAEDGRLGRTSLLPCDQKALLSCLPASSADAENSDVISSLGPLHLTLEAFQRLSLSPGATTSQGHTLVV